jgi:predicted HTH transcriptional regulator
VLQSCCAALCNQLFLIWEDRPPDRRHTRIPQREAGLGRRYRICEERGTGFQKVIQDIELFGLPPLQITAHENAFSVTLCAPRALPTWAPPSASKPATSTPCCSTLQPTLTNTSLRQRFQLHDKQRNSITNLIADAVAAGRIKRKDSSSGNKLPNTSPLA